MADSSSVPHISDKFLAYLRRELANPDISYHSPLTPVQGGYETRIYRFKLTGARADLSNDLILRLYPDHYGARNAIWESTIQNVLASVGFPVARAHVVCTDSTVLSGAFFVMDFLPGQPLMAAPPDTVPGLLGTTHAELHTIDPQPLIDALAAQGIAASDYSLDHQYEWLQDKTDKPGWLHDAITWLVDHRPPEPEHPVVCHGDYHPSNILVEDGRVSGVLDWSGFVIWDPALDIANTIVLATIPAKHLLASIDGFADVDWNRFVEVYLAAYQHTRPLDRTQLDYYKVRRCVLALVHGLEGPTIWRQPPIVADLLAAIHKIAGIQVAIPDFEE